jgi:hypothetical protein
MTGNISLEEARGLRGMGTGAGGVLPDLDLPRDMRDSLRGVSARARADVDLTNQIGEDRMMNLINATNKAAMAMESLATKIDTLKL